MRKHILPLVLIASGCSTGALKNTEKLTKEGHVSLYENGAFRVPSSQILLIPPGPDITDLAMLLGPVPARKCFLDSVRNAEQSYWIVYDGAKFSYRAAKGIHKGSSEADAVIKKLARPGSVLIMKKSSKLARTIVGRSFEFYPAAQEAAAASTTALAAAAHAAGEAAAANGAQVSERSVEVAREMREQGKLAAGQALSSAARQFTIGYAAVPQAMRERKKEAAKDYTEADFSGALTKAEANRAAWSKTTVDILHETVGNYSKNVGASLGNAARELGNAKEIGVSFAMLRSMRWVLQGTFGDALILPAAKLSGASFGYLGVNAAAFPCIVIANEGKASAQLAVEIVWDGAKAAYDLTAPTPVAAVAAIFGLSEGLVTQAGSAAVQAGGWTAGKAESYLGKAAAVTVEYGSRGAGVAMHYVGVPLAQAGVTVGSGVVGAALGTAGIGTGAAVRAGGEVGAAGALVFGNALAGTTLVGGTAVATEAAAGYDVYQLSKGVVVSASYELGVGIVLDYKTISQLGAQSILGVADCSYLVLSLEGPRWVIYAVKGKKDDGSDLPTGAVIDLKKLQQSGEEIRNVPVSDDEMRGVVNSVYDNLPTLPETKAPDLQPSGAH